eukprot:COSAG04_NODE_136_length_23756_cov_16.820645_5_plen_74_part_00
MDTSTLKSILVGIFSIATTVIPILGTLIPPNATKDDAHPCELDAMEIARVRAAMLGHNSSCSYNQTIGSVINW